MSNYIAHLTIYAVVIINQYPKSEAGLAHLASLQWRHNEHDSVSNHQPHDCLLNRLLRLRSKKTSKLHVTGICAGNSPATGEFVAQMASSAENVSIWWRHHVAKENSRIALVYRIVFMCLSDMCLAIRKVRYVSVTIPPITCRWWMLHTQDILAYLQRCRSWYSYIMTRSNATRF